MTKRTIYLSGPMTGYPENNFPEFRDWSRKLRCAGYPVISPAEIVPPETYPTWDDYLRADIKAMASCDIIAMLPGWHKSKGALRELASAISFGMAVALVEDL